MAPTKQNKNGRKVRNPRSNRRSKPVLRGLGLDSAAAEYARLLVDPCNAPLTHPVYGGGDSGYLVRVDKVFVVGRGTGVTSGLIQWTPGDINGGGTEFLSAGGADYNTGYDVVAFADASPGRAFLQTNAATYRCVAACAKFTFPGTEAGRSGWVHYGQGTGRTVLFDDLIAAASVGRLCPNYSRTPADTVEVVWRPDFADQQMIDPNAEREQRGGTGSVLFAFGGFPADVGIVVHMTAVYEWTPKSLSDGPSQPVNDKNKTNNTLDQVIGAIRRTGFNWVRDAMHSAGQTLTAGMIAGISNTFGVMPSVSRARSMRNLTF